LVVTTHRAATATATAETKATTATTATTAEVARGTRHLLYLTHCATVNLNTHLGGSAGAIEPVCGILDGENIRKCTLLPGGPDADRYVGTIKRLQPSDEEVYFLAKALQLCLGSLRA
jgi:hypothetical protein